MRVIGGDGHQGRWHGWVDGSWPLALAWPLTVLISWILGALDPLDPDTRRWRWRTKDADADAWFCILALYPK